MYKQRYMLLSLKCKISAILLVGTAYIFLIFLIATVQMSTECDAQGSEAGCGYLFRDCTELLIFMDIIFYSSVILD